MADEITGTETAATEDTPVDIITPKDATAERIARTLTPEQAKAFRARRKEQKAKEKATAPAAEAVKAEDNQTIGQSDKGKPEAKAEAKAEPEGEVISFGDEAETATTTTTGTEDAPAELSEDELSKLDEKARKRITEASKEAAKVRKRAQEAEAKLAEKDTELAELRQKIEAAEKEAGEGQARMATLAGNSFVHFKDGHAVAAWGENAKEALTLIKQHEREVKAGRRDADDPILHTLPNGEEVELRSTDANLFTTRLQDAQAWFTHDAELAKHRETATKLADKHQSTKGYKEARDAYLKDAALTTRLDELVAKAALYDVLQSRRAVITFPDAAGAAKKAPSPAEESKSATRKTPPSETAASTPRLAHADDAGSDLKARKSLLMEKARTAKTEDERQRLLKQAILLGPVQRTAVRRVA